VTEKIYHEKWMLLAIQEAKKALQLDDVPVGSIIVLDGKVVGAGYNKSISECNPTSHAEINSIIQASEQLQNYRLLNATIYTTLEPCTMCYGAIVHSRIKNIFFGAYDKKTGVCGSCLSLNNSSCFNHYPNITGGILEYECSQLLKNFFEAKR